MKRQTVALMNNSVTIAFARVCNTIRFTKTGNDHFIHSLLYISRDYIVCLIPHVTGIVNIWRSLCGGKTEKSKYLNLIFCNSVLPCIIFDGTISSVHSFIIGQKHAILIIKRMHLYATIYLCKLDGCIECFWFGRFVKTQIKQQGSTNLLFVPKSKMTGQNSFLCILHEEKKGEIWLITEVILLTDN